MTDTLYGIWGSTLTDIANSIRTKNPYVHGLVDPADMAQDILDIPSGGGGGTTVNSITIVEEQPTTFTDDTVVLVPNGEQIVPYFPYNSGLTHNVVCVNAGNSGSSTQRPTYSQIVNGTKFWLFQHTQAPRCRRDSITIITWGSSGTTSVRPTKIYEYDTSGPFEWVDITNDADTESDFENDVIMHDIRDTIYSSDYIFRWTVGNLEYNMKENQINEYCRITDIYHISEFITYYTTGGATTNLGSHTLKWVAANYS